MKTAMISLQALLCTPEPSDPQDAEVANMYLGNRAKYVEVAKFWTESYARPAGSSSSSSEVSPLHFIVKSINQTLAQLYLFHCV